MAFIVDPSGIAADPSRHPQFGWQGRSSVGVNRNHDIWMDQIRDAKNRMAVNSGNRPILSRARGAVSPVKSGYLSSRPHRAGMKMLKDDMGINKGVGRLGRILGLGFLGYQVLSGFQEGGITGAAKSAAEYAAVSYGIGTISNLTGITTGLAMGVGATAGPLAIGLFAGEAWSGGTSMAQLAARPAVREHMRKRAKLEMGSPVQDQYGTVATMRKRGLMAMRQSKITARGAMGMEGNHRYMPYMR